MSASRQYSDCDWFYHIPQKSTKTDKSQVQLPPTSQIPGLSKLAEPHKEINFASRRLWIKDTDSDYIKLAKQGGRADLLKHHSPPPRKSPPAPCSQPEWFVHAPPSSKNKEVSKWYLPEYMIHEEFIPSPSNSKPGKLLHDPDKTALEKEVEDNEKENKGKLKLPEIADKKQKDKAFTKKTAQEDNLENKFPSMPLPKKNEPINFTKLIANGYAEDWIQQRKEWKKIQPNVKMKEPGDLVPLDEFQEALEKKELLRNSKSRGRKAISTKVDQNVTFRDPLTDSKAKTSFILNKFRDMPA
ncbi:uncharacterized protein C7orf57-like isoform X4 [Scyliorhinus torazame]|uniref:uncharacterized protein C7orf57-like isoform X4 n=1 Tax=Scyliorhinus torazame TaxID=75743 RepID=UPI003B5AAFC4